jgi:hypothetical protein
MKPSDMNNGVESGVKTMNKFSVQGECMCFNGKQR